MPMFTAAMIDDVRRVLDEAAIGKSQEQCFLTAYQVLDRMRDEYRNRLVEGTGALGGEGAGVQYSASSAVAAIMKTEQLKDIVETKYIDAQSIQFQVAGQQIRAGYCVCGIYRLR